MRPAAGLGQEAREQGRGGSWKHIPVSGSDGDVRTQLAQGLWQDVSSVFRANQGEASASPRSHQVNNVWRQCRGERLGDGLGRQDDRRLRRKQTCDFESGCGCGTDGGEAMRQGLDVEGSRAAGKGVDGIGAGEKEPVGFACVRDGVIEREIGRGWIDRDRRNAKNSGAQALKFSRKRGTLLARAGDENSAPGEWKQHVPDCTDTPDSGSSAGQLRQSELL